MWIQSLIPHGFHFCVPFKERGVDGVLCVTSDAHQGLRRAIEEVFTGAAWQRCIVHMERNVVSCCKTRRIRNIIGRIVSSVFRETDPHLVRELYSRAIDEVRSLCKSAGDMLEEAEADALVYLDFPEEHRRRLRTNNVQERMNREIKRRSRVVQVFPSIDSLVRLLGSALAEKDEEWACRHYFKGSSIRRVFERQRPEKPCEDIDALSAKAVSILEIAKDEDIVIGRRAA